MRSNNWIIIGAVSGLLSVAIGAFGAHGLKDMLDGDMLDIYQTGVQYQMFHAVALLVTGILLKIMGESRSLQWAGRCFTAGTILFSGSLYALSLSGVSGLGAITPLGGVAFLAGWLLIIIGVYRTK